MENNIHIADETFIAAPSQIVRETLDSVNWRAQWPDLIQQVTQDRGELGIRWKISGPIEGTMELWLETRLDGVLVHFFLHAISLNPKAKTMKIVGEVPQKTWGILPNWKQFQFGFLWDQHGVRRNARRIVYNLKKSAESRMQKI